MEDLNKKPLSFKQYLVVSSLLFALFFGAGNLIFPLHLGQLAGAHWFTAMLGFLCTGVTLPLLSVLAISVTRSKGVYDIGTPLGSTFALVFMVLIHATIGPLFGTPRTATVPFAVGIQPFLPSNFICYGLIVFSFLFFLAAFLLSYKESSGINRNGLGAICNRWFTI
ncbi:Branched-chain amino acid transport system 2 carrier protein [Apilactobacillus kunkeei]|nr:Branched-chain amino acid transport system 2 carrier protein [Apilactobacillus kunkeei]CAI2694313.1 Branched-chain amino acid transport system 2 carrier protein [Apilactobacillus kunkeei]